MLNKFILIVSLFIGFQSLAIDACKLDDFKNTKTLRVDKIFNYRSFCLVGVGCSQSVAPATQAEKEGYSDCERVGGRSGALVGVGNSSNIDFVCYKDVEQVLSTSEKKDLICNKLLSCLAEGSIDFEKATAILKLFEIRCSFKR